MTVPETLRSRLTRKPIVVAPGVYDPLTALIATQAGFSTLYVSGAAIAYTRLGRPDIGLVSMSAPPGGTSSTCEDCHSSSWGAAAGAPCCASTGALAQINAVVITRVLDKFIYRPLIAICVSRPTPSLGRLQSISWQGWRLAVMQSIIP